MARAKKFGAFSGVFTPSVLAILGVIMYLRLPWIVGQAGLWSVLGIILVAHIISIATGLSVASVATDKKVETGGSYYIISRSLGLPIGGTLGMALFVGFSFSVSLYLIGFAETFLNTAGMELSLQNIRIAGSIILLVVTAVTFISTSLAIKAQYLIMGAIGLSLLSIFWGSHGFAATDPLLRPADEVLPWIALFAIFFPAVTGFQAGVSMSGDLKNPGKAIPVGTISAIIVGFIIYAGLATFFALTVDRDMLLHDPRVLFEISMVPELVIAGILAATLSSAMVSILSAPRVLQAVAMDRILPRFFAKGYGASNEPRNALIVAYLIAQAGILIGELNVIARIVTIFFILTYGFLNITYAIESWAGSDFRPSFKIPRFVSIIGAIACIVVMIQLDIVALIVASVILVALFLFLKKKELTLQTGDTWTGVWSSLVKTGLIRLSSSGSKIRNWRPNVMLFSGGEKNRPHLVEMGRALVGKMGVFTNFELSEQPSGDILFGVKEIPTLKDTRQEDRDVFTRKHTCRDIYEGIDLISRVYGFTGFEPNTVLMGWGRKSRKPEKFAELLNNLQRQDFNCLFLSYDKEKGFGNYKTIDFWWKGHGRGLSLAVFLMKFITSGDLWRTARIRILVINTDSSKTESLYGLIRQVLENHRLRADVKVIYNGVDQLPVVDIIGAESRNTDLTIMELPEFSHRAAESAFTQVNAFADSAGTSLFISPSTVFDTFSLLGFEEDSTESIPEEKSRPSADIFNSLRFSANEIIANEVNNIGQTAGRFAQKFFEQGPERILKLDLRFFPEIRHFALRTTDSLERLITETKPADLPMAFLRILNDFSFHSQRQIQMLREQRISSIKTILEEATLEYLDALRAMRNVMPEYIYLKRSREQLALKKEDSLRTRIYKARKILLTYVLRRPVTHKIRVIPSAEYFLYHRRLKSLQQMLADFSMHTFTEVVEIRKLLNGIHELIEKSRLDPESKPKLKERIKLERSRLDARLKLLEQESQQFFFSAGQQFYEELLHDLEHFSHHLESTGANIRSAHFSSRSAEIPALTEDISGFASTWSRNLELFINKATLDFYVLSLKGRIHSKIKKYHSDLKTSLESNLVRRLESFEHFAEGILESPGGSAKGQKRLDHETLKTVPVSEIYHGLYVEIGELMRDIPEKVAVTADHQSKIKETAFIDAGKVEVSFRKTVEYYIGSELIDHCIRVSNEKEVHMQQIISGIRDAIRLLNFGLDSESKNDALQEQDEQHEQTLTLVRNFLERVKIEKGKILGMAGDMEEKLEEGLRRAFDPLSAATISTSSMAVRRKTRESEQGELSNNIVRQWQKVKEVTRNRFVDLMYSKSEGQLWISYMAKGDTLPAAANKPILSFVEAITPLQSVMKELPFYYTSLFSGHSGTSEDFWVGMKHEMDECKRAIQRFKAGYAGALIITGTRSSGKSSLSKKMAEMHFSRDHIHTVRAPQGCNADVDLFTQKLMEALQVQNNRLHDAFRALPSGKAIIIQDLGLWWERRQGGDAVVQMIRELIDLFGHKCLFIININSHALELIHQQTQIGQHALDTVVCEPFDARELKDMLLLRHQAGGMKYKYNKKEEDRMTAWDQARLFNKLFELSYGNPGTATILWLSAIRKVSGKTIVMDPFHLPSNEVFDLLTSEQWFYIQQFVINRRMGADKLAANLERPYEEVKTNIRNLMRTGILVERFEGIYTIRPGLDLYMIDQLKKKKRI
ncbi:MAG: amino acid permease [Bacteroidia bacterium]|nr:MAG: amino acid permease [Bacteroidia bacterium]